MPMPIKMAGDWRAVGQLMRRHVVGVCMRDEPARLPPAEVDRQIDAGKLQSAVEVEHRAGLKSENSKLRWYLERKCDDGAMGWCEC
jgi:hypothetical protein